METKEAIAFTVLAFIASSSIFHLPVKAYPTTQKPKGYPYANSNGEVDCSHSLNGYKISSPTSCSEFYECVHGVAYLFQCANMTDGGKLYFDQQLQRCNWPSQVDCEVPSTEPTVTTSVTDSSDDEKPKEFEQVQRILSPIENPSVDCSQAENGDKIPSPTSCSEYFVCVMGNAYLYQCPLIAGGGRLYFDIELGVCNWPWMVECEITTTESPSTTTMTTIPSKTTTTEHGSTTAIQINSTTLEPTTEATTKSINTTVEPTTSEKPQTSTQSDDSSTTSETTSSQSLSTSTTQEAKTTTMKETTEQITTSVNPKTEVTTSNDILIKTTHPKN